MSGDHDHDELYAREEVTEGQFDDIDTALDSAYTAIQLLTHVCRSLLERHHDATNLRVYLDKVESLVGELHEDPTPAEDPT